MYDDEYAFMSCEDRNYYRDRRVTARYIEKPDRPFRWEVCDLCDGEGKVVNPSIDANGLTAEDFAEDYFRGRYDITCPQCRGRTTIPVVENPNEPYQDRDGEFICSNPEGHEFECTGTAYGGDDESYHGEGRCYCIYCGADGDA
jgi:hypothetical protein